MKHFFYFVYMLAFLSCSEQTQQIDAPLINVKDAMNAVQPIVLSEITSKVTYIPLEMTDSSLIGDKPDIRVFNDYILVSSLNQNLKLFERKTGQFLTEIGHIGQDPQGYAKQSWGTLDYWVDSDRNLIYVKGWKNNWLVYDVHNQYIKQVTFEDEDRYALHWYTYLMDGDTIYGQNKMRRNHTAPSLFSYDCSSASFTEIPGLLNEEPLPMGAMFLYWGAYVSFGGDLVVEKYSEDKQSHTVVNSPTLWKSENQIRVKQPFNDTIYTIRNNQLKPSMIFDLGKWHWEHSERMDVPGCKEKIAIGYVYEIPEMLYFHFHTGVYHDNRETYCGIYKKGTGEVKIMQGDNWTDLQYSQQFHIRTTTNDGRFCGLISPDKFSKELMEKFQLTEDSNPVVVVL